MYSPIKISEFLHRKKEPVQIEPNKNYSLVTVKLHHKGVVLREKKKGSLIGSNMYKISKGQFILSGIDARNGAFGIVPDDLDGAIVTNDFWYFDVDESKVKRDFFYWLTNTPLFLDACQKSSKGETQRIRLQKDLFFNFEFHFPPVEKQSEFLNRFSIIDANLSELKTEHEEQSSCLSLLRQAILQEAIEGKLTDTWRKKNPVRKGDPDYDGEALLDKIQAEKEKLIKEGKIKKQKPHAPIKAEEVPFELPDGWVWTRLGMTGNVIRGKSPVYSDNSTLIVLNQKCIRWFYIDTSWGKSVSDKWLSSISADFFTENGDILINSTGEGTIGRAAIVRDSAKGLLFDSHVLKYSSEINDEYSLYCLNSIFCQNQVEESKGAKTTKQTELGVDNLSNFIIPIPPLVEQEAIVDRVEKLISMVDELEKQVFERKEQSEQLLLAVLREAFESK